MKKLSFLAAIVVFLVSAQQAYAQPYGAGSYGANVPYGGQTVLTIATNGNVALSVSPSDSGTLATGVSTVTVTSTDVVGYKLYVRSVSSTNFTNGAATLPASGNVSLAALGVNTWGYNTVGGSNFLGMTLTDALIRDGVGPFASGDITNVTYGVKIDNSKPAGNYTGTIMYTAIPQTD